MSSSADTPTPCPRKGKRKFATEADAERTLHNIWRNGWHRGPGYMPCRSYLCRCGHWHLTSRPLDVFDRPAGEVTSSSHRPDTEGHHARNA
ncbi:hypothetical protein HOT45_gp38 [Gordonia phage Trine]|uniref:Uncharacterized protein n=1 Tax=Gordonia phage Trine TaxID=2201431 RepID=A0A2Z4Q9A0_9CAUD|nr:hypothetical protein HOT45_gp38 [Gordonia phage Trine]AWY06540.1 hypothetical protein PBI_TRINE_38 [Gordonia phage Trine]